MGLKIVECESVLQAADQKNHKTLILLKDYAFDEGSIKLIAEKKNACFLIDVGRIIRSRGVPRAILMSKIRTFLSFCVRFGAFYTFTDLSEKESNRRSPEEMVAIASLLGINRGQANFAMKMLKHY